MPKDQSSDLTPPLALTIDPTAIEPLVRRVVEETLAQVAKDDARLNGAFCYSEEEAARLLGLEPHVLRDERRRGRIQASQIVGRRIRYLPEDLTAYLASRRIN